MKATKHIHREAKQLWRLCVVDGQRDERRVRQVVQLIVDGRRPGGLAVLSYFLRLVRLDRNRRRTKVESAVPVPPDVRAHIETGLTRMYGGGLAIEYEDDPTLIGGVRISVGSDVFDGSVRGALATLAARFSEARVTL